MHILLAINWIWGTKQRGRICSLALTFPMLIDLLHYFSPVLFVKLLSSSKACETSSQTLLWSATLTIYIRNDTNQCYHSVQQSGSFSCRRWPVEHGLAKPWAGREILGMGSARETHELWAEQAFVPETGEEPGEQRSRAKTLLLQERSLIGFRSFVGSGGLELIIKEVLSISVFLCVLDLSKGNRVSLCEGLSFFFCFKRLLSPRRLQVIRDMGAYSVLQWIWKQSISNILM